MCYCALLLKKRKILQLYPFIFTWFSNQPLIFWNFILSPHKYKKSFWLFRRYRRIIISLRGDNGGTVAIGSSRDHDVDGGHLFPLRSMANLQRHTFSMDSLLPHSRRLSLLIVNSSSSNLIQSLIFFFYLELIVFCLAGGLSEWCLVPRVQTLS